MKKNITAKEGLKQSSKQGQPKRKRHSAESQKQLTIGMDVGDRTSRYCVVDGAGEVVQEASIATTKKALQEVFGTLQYCRIAIEVGTHSPWISRLLSSFGHEVIVANARQLKLITESTRKDDRLDAQTLARLARIDPQLLRPIRHRSEQAQLALLEIRVRAALVEARTALVNSARGLVKALGERLPKCDTDHMGVERMASLPSAVQQALQPLLEQVESLTEKIHAWDERIAQIARTQYPETALLQQISGVGTLIALTFVLTIEDPQRFAKSRDVGCYVGLRPKRSESGERRPQLRITKEGDVYLRKLLVEGAHYIVGKCGPDTDLQRWGRKLAARGGKNAKKRALVAVARKLAILLHRLWVTGEVYEPLRNSHALEAATKQKAA
jgi:transposase